MALAFAFVRGRPFGVDLLWRMAVATSCGLVLATIAAGYFVYRITGMLISPWCILRVMVALAIAIGIGRLCGPHGLLPTLVTASCLALLYLVVLVVLHELTGADWSRLSAIVRRRPG